jgi:hypothetical protein
MAPAHSFYQLPWAWAQARLGGLSPNLLCKTSISDRNLANSLDVI